MLLYRRLSSRLGWTPSRGSATRRRPGRFENPRYSRFGNLRYLGWPLFCPSGFFRYSLLMNQQSKKPQTYHGQAGGQFGYSTGQHPECGTQSRFTRFF